MNKSSELKGFNVFIMEYTKEAELCCRKLEDMGARLTWGRPTTDSSGIYSEAELIEKCKDVDAVIKISRDVFTEPVFKASPKLRVIVKCGIGVDKEPLELAAQYGIAVANTAPTVVRPVAELTISLILACLRQLPNILKVSKEGKLRSQGLTMKLMEKKRIGLLGFGNIARTVARLLSGWGNEIIAYDPFIKAEIFKDANVRQVSFEELLETSDIVSIHMPLTDLSRGLIGKKEFAMMKDGVFFINTARGEIVQNEPLIQALQDKKVAYAGLDVVEGEPLPLDHPLLHMSNVMVTPHVGGAAVEASALTAEIALQEVIDALSGKLPQYLVNPQCGNAWNEKYRTVL